MTKLNLSFNNYNSALQSNSISIQFPLVRDETVYGGYVTQYRYKYYYSPIYCETAGQSGYAYCDSDSWQSDGNWIEVKPTISGDKGEFDFIIPPLSCDALFKIEVQVYEDGTKSYYSSTANSITPYFIGFYNRDTEVSFQAIERHSTGQEESIEIRGKLNQIGFCKPVNYRQDLDSIIWKNYCSAMLQQFIGAEYSDTLFQINCQLSLSNNWKDAVSVKVLAIDWTNLSEWRPHEFALSIDVKDECAKFSSQDNVFAQLDYKINIAKEATDFKFYGDGETHTTSSLLLPAAISSFQIKRRSVKAQMLEEDKALRDLSTGAGMFNHSNLVGCYRSPMREKFQYEVFYPAYDFGLAPEADSRYKLMWAKLPGHIDTQDKVTLPELFKTMSQNDIEKIACHILLSEEPHGDITDSRFILEVNGTFKLDESNSTDTTELYSISANGVIVELTHASKTSQSADLDHIKIYTNENSHDFSYLSVELTPPSGIEFDPECGHSIALYDTHAKDDSPANQPSIGFMDDEHNCKAYLKWNGNALVSNVPIYHGANDPEGNFGNTQKIELGIADGSTIKIEGYFTVT